MYKIIKRIHAYSGNGKIEYLIYEKKLFGWKRCYDFAKSYNNYGDAEREIIGFLSKNQGGIIEIDGNIYKLYPLELPLP
jgi:hypothetical protein